MIVVSHARDFLNTVCTDIIHLHTRTLAHYRGTYDNFVKSRNEVRLLFFVLFLIFCVGFSCCCVHACCVHALCVV